MQNVQPDAGLPADWAEKVMHAYLTFAYGSPGVPLDVSRLGKSRGVQRQLRDQWGRWIRRRNDPSSMADAPSPFLPNIRHPVPLHNLLRSSVSGFPPDVYERLSDYLHVKANYLSRNNDSERWAAETANIILAARDNPDLMITVFRPAPDTINHFVPGDTVVLSSGYAATTAAARPRWRVLNGTIPARELFTRSDTDLMRWEWRGRAPFRNGGVSKVYATRGRLDFL